MVLALSSSFRRTSETDVSAKRERNVASRMALAAALVALLVPWSGAVAQLAPVDPAVAITMPTETLSLGAGNNTTLAATVTNPGSFAGTVSLSFAALDGWAVSAEPASFALAAGASQPVTITVVAPLAGEGAASGAIAATATLSDSAGRTATAEGATPVARVDPPVVPPPEPPYALWALAAVLLVAIVALGVGLQLRARRRKRERAEAEARAVAEAKRRAEEEAARLAAEKAAAEAAFLARETGISIAVHDGPRPFGSKRELAYRLTVSNVSDRPRVGVVAVAEVAAGWRASVSLPKLPLSPGESVLVSAYVNPDENVPSGSKARIVILAKPEEAQERDERVVIEVEAPLPHVPTAADAARARTTLREAVAARPALRK